MNCIEKRNNYKTAGDKKPAVLCHKRRMYIFYCEGIYMFHSLLLVIALSIDGFLASIAYGARNIRISVWIAFLVSAVGTTCLGISFFFAQWITSFIPVWICSWISFGLFFFLGISSFCKGMLKTAFKNRSKRQLTFACSGFSFVLDIYMDETKADMDFNKRLSVKEGLYLAIALSLDSLVSGIACAGGIDHPCSLLLCSFMIGGSVLLAGIKIGNVWGKIERWNLSWISGIVFLILAFTRIV